MAIANSAIEFLRMDKSLTEFSSANITEEKKKEINLHKQSTLMLVMLNLAYMKDEEIARFKFDQDIFSPDLIFKP